MWVIHLAVVTHITLRSCGTEEYSGLLTFLFLHYLKSEYLHVELLGYRKYERDYFNGCMICTCTCRWNIRNISGIYELLLQNVVCNKNVQRSKDTAVVCIHHMIIVFQI